MYRRMFVLLFVCSAGVPAVAQDLSNIQIHGFVTQGLLYSSHNNYLTANTTNGSVQWTDGAISVSDSVTDKLRVGIQRGSEEFTRNIEGVAEAAKSTSQGADESQQSVKELAHASTQLRELVAQFKY